MDNLQVLNAMLYMAENGNKWCRLPESFGNWHTIYTRLRRWAKAGVLDWVFEELQRQQVLQMRIELVSLDSTSVKVHPDVSGALKRRPPVHRQVQRRMEHQDSSGCRGWANGRDLLPVSGAGRRRPAGQAFAEEPGSDPPECLSGDGQGVRRG